MVVMASIDGKMQIFDTERYSSGDKPEYKIFTSGISEEFTFLIDNSGNTFVITETKNGLVWVSVPSDEYVSFEKRSNQFTED
jgi:predicted transcriptional regulator YdeE